MSLNIETTDNLEVIRGIGPDAREWLAETFDVRSLTALAELPEEVLISRIKADNKPFMRWARDWPAEAAIIVEKMRVEEETEYPVRTLVEDLPTNKSTNLQNEKNESGIRESMPSIVDKQWKQVAYFNITFLELMEEDQITGRKTTINYHEADQNAEWDGFETEQISQWILEQAGNELDQEIQEVPEIHPETKAIKEESDLGLLAITISSLHLYQPADSEISLAVGKKGQPYAGIIQSDQPFAVKVNFELDEPAKATIGKQGIPYTVQFFIQDRSTGDKMHLGDTEPGLLSSKISSYTDTLEEITVLPGTYRLRVVAIAESKDVTPGYLELPILRVL